MTMIKGVLALVAAWFLTALAAADGGFLPHGVEAKPTIPYQRAFLSWRDGKETLIVESVLNAPVGDYAWIVPLPSVPSKLEACTPGTLESVAQLARPEIDPVDSNFAGAGIVLLGYFSLAAMRTATRRRAPGESQTLRFLYIVLVATPLLLIALAIVCPVYAGLGDVGASKNDVVIHSAGDAGPYRYEVVSSGFGGGLRAWLAENGYAMPAKAGAAIDAYVAKRWCFAAMKLRHDLPGSVAPIPVRFVFDSREPIYPMALTGATNDRLRLDLFVVADGLAMAKGLEVWRAQPVESKRITQDAEEAVKVNKTVRNVWLPIGHPEIAPSLWDGATLTYLRGDLSGTEIQRDLRISIGARPREAYSKTLYSFESAFEQALAYAALGAAGMVFVLTLCATRKPFALRDFANVFAVSGSLGVVGAAVWFCTVTKVPTVLVENPIKLHAHAYDLGKVLGAGREDGDTRPFPYWWLATLREHWNRDPTEGDVPGGYQLKPTASGWKLRVYDSEANPTDYNVNKKGDPVRIPKDEE